MGDWMIDVLCIGKSSSRNFLAIFMANNSSLPRLNNIVILRSVAAIEVVVYHCYIEWIQDGWFQSPIGPLYNYIFRVVFSGRMPLFVFVSGYLFSHLVLDRGKYAIFRGFLKNKFERLLLPLLVFGGIMSLAFHHDYWHLILYQPYHLWFLEMLFGCFIAGWLLNKFVRQTPLRLLAFGCAVAMTKMDVFPILSFPYFCQHFMFFYGGYLFYAYRNNLRFVFKRYFASGLFCAYLGCLWIALCPDRYSNIIGSDNAMRIYAYSMFLLKPISVLLALIGVEYYLLRFPILPTFFTKLNNISYGIYLFHYYILLSLGPLLRHPSIKPLFEAHYIATPPLLCIIVLSLSIGICMFLKRYSWSKWVIG